VLIDMFRAPRPFPGHKTLTVKPPGTADSLQKRDEGGLVDAPAVEQGTTMEEMDNQIKTQRTIMSASVRGLRVFALSDGPCKHESCRSAQTC
jgi:hypothetical protein